MKKILLFFAIVCVAFTSCNDDIFSGGRTTAKIGDKIDFSGSTKYETAGDKKRTVYGDKLTSATEIKWALGDAVRIYCAEAHGGVKECDYTVEDAFNNQTPLKDKTDDSSYEECSLSCDGEGLLWGTGAHNFYAVYPSPKMLSIYGEDTDVASAIKLEGNKVTATLPNVQRPRQYVAATDGNYIVHPAMRYAYMVAAATGIDPSKNANVTLEFNPIVTAVEISLKNKGTATIEGITNVAITSDNELCGDFEVEISSGNITRKSTGDNYKTIQIPLVEQGSSIDLAPEKTITFTAFMTPAADLKSLKITFYYANGVAQKQATISTTSNNGILVEAKKKNFIANVPMKFAEVISKVDMKKWAASISSDDANNTLAKLSIPAAGGAASGHTNNWATSEKYLEQSLTIGDLWDAGIRCFEFTVDDGSETAFKNQKVYCNSKPSDITLEEAVNQVKGKLMAYPSEFAMVIITYQNNSGWANRNTSSGAITDNNRKPATFMSNLNSFWSSLEFKYENGTNKATIYTVGPKQETITLGTALYSPTMKIIDARGKLFCIARPTSQGEDNAPVISGGSNNISGTNLSRTLDTTAPHEHILVIDGWGTLKDKWEVRGFTKNPYKRGTGNDAYNNADKDDLGGEDNKPGRPFEASRELPTANNGLYSTLNSYSGGTSKLTLTPNFTYTIRNSSGSAGNAWVQEWARIAKKNENFCIEEEDTDGDGYLKYVQWIESLTEKESHITATLDKALNSTDNTIYINSLCGYYIETTSNDKNSAVPNILTDLGLNRKKQLWGAYYTYPYSPVTASSKTSGMCGNISDFAKDINQFFYDYLLTKKLGGNSTGIIMMDRVSKDAKDNVAGYYIPRIILANNPFAPGQTTEEQPKIKVIDEEVTEDDKLAAPARRDATDNEYSIVWK